MGHPSKRGVRREPSSDPPTLAPGVAQRGGASGPGTDPESMRQEIESLRAEVRHLRSTVEMLLSMIAEGERPSGSAGTPEPEENPPFYN